MAPGVFFVFKDKVLYQRYLLSRSRSHSFLKRANLKLAPKRTPEERDKEKYEEYKELLETLWIQWIDFGREPTSNEAQNLDLLKKAFGSLGRALRFLRSQKNDSLLVAAEESKRDDGIDVVSIVTPNHMHAAPAIEFLDKNIHVICYKPMTSTMEDAHKLVEAVSKSDAHFFLTHN